MNRRLIPLALILLLQAPLAPAAPDAAGDGRLREQLRAAVTELRRLEDENIALKVRLERAPPPAAAAAESAELEALRADAEAARARAAALEQQLALARQEQARSQAAGEQAARLARERDEAAQQFEAGLRRSNAALAACGANNVTLVAIGSELLARYRDKGFVETARRHEPLLGLRRVEFERLEQEYRQRIGDAEFLPGVAPAATAPATTTP